MLSKTASIALLAGATQALTQGGTTYAADLTCTKCVMSNYKWCIDAANYFSSGASALSTSSCKEVWGTCSTDSSLRVYDNKDIELAACPQLSTECGTTLTYDITDAATTATIVPAGTIAVDTKCSYVVKSTVGPIMYAYGGDQTAATNLEISFAQWTDDARVTMDSTHTYFPSTGSSANFVDTTSYSGTTVFPRGVVSNGFTTDLAYTDMVTAIDTYNTAKATYLSDVATVLEENEKIRVLNWWEQALGMTQDAWEECPQWIGDYTGSDMYNTVSNGGYGDPTSGIYTLDGTNNKLYWGKYGTSASTDSNIDRNTDLTATRYLLITYIAKVGTTATTAAATGTASIGTFDSSMTAYMAEVTAPTATTECIGATWIKVGAAAIAVAATLF
mmetsp:Transcript_8281/g.12668  ORF Transcript_8281/g.12668 Transcript_8281/m.12668 type:complete len:389 (-) Transcript_8281:43-1209(-)